MPVSMLLITVSILNAVYFFTRIKYYHLFHRADLVSSPGAELVDRDDLDHTGLPELPSIVSRSLSQSLHIFWTIWFVIAPTASDSDN